MGAWIEILELFATACGFLSLLSWERGLKFGWCYTICIIASVAPLVGAWIEIFVMLYMSLISFVAPLVGAWIEIMDLCRSVSALLSLLSWERGLKSYEPLASLSQVVSLLSWERGLKSYEPLASLSQVVSLLSWERGLKSDGSFGKHVRFARRSSRGSVD